MNTLARPADVCLDETLLFEKLPHGALVVDREGVVLMTNRKAGETFAALGSRRPKAGDRLLDLIESQRPLLMEDIRAAASGGRLGLRVVLGRPPLRLRVGALQPRGPYILSMSDPEAVDKAFGRLRNQLRDANMVAARERRLRQEAEHAYRAIENFSTIAAHDLRQPLRNITDLLTFLVEDFGEQLPPDAMSLIETAQGSAARLLSLISDLLQHSRIGSEPMEKSPVEVDTVVAEIAADFAPVLEETGGRIESVGPLGIVEAVPQLFRMLLENLIGNALKYRSTDRPPVVTIRRSPTGRVMEVADNGRGFAPEEAKKMFEPFTRLVSDPSIEGTGIGLASCSTIAMRHGWSIQAEGRPGEGASFFLLGLT